MTNTATISTDYLSLIDAGSAVAEQHDTPLADNELAVLGRLLKLLKGQPFAVIQAAAALTNLSIIEPKVFDQGPDAVATYLASPPSQVSQNTIISQIQGGAAIAKRDGAYYLHYPGKAVVAVSPGTTAESILFGQLGVRLGTAQRVAYYTKGAASVTAGTKETKDGAAKGSRAGPLTCVQFDFSVNLADLPTSPSATIDCRGIVHPTTGQLFSAAQIRSLVSAIRGETQAAILLDGVLGSIPFPGTGYSLDPPTILPYGQAYGWEAERSLGYITEWVHSLPAEAFTKPLPAAAPGTPLPSPASSDFNALLAAPAPGPSREDPPASLYEHAQPAQANTLGGLEEEVLSEIARYRSENGANNAAARNAFPAEGKLLAAASRGFRDRSAAAITASIGDALGPTLLRLTQLSGFRDSIRSHPYAPFLAFLLVRTNLLGISPSPPYILISSATTA